VASTHIFYKKRVCWSSEGKEKGGVISPPKKGKGAPGKEDASSYLLKGGPLLLLRENEVKRGVYNLLEKGGGKKRKM